MIRICPSLQIGAVCVCGGGRQLDISDPEVADAALKIQAAMKGMLARHRITLELEADSTDRIAVEDETDLPDTDEVDDGGPVTMPSDHSQTSQHQEQSDRNQDQLTSTQDGQERDEDDDDQ